MKRDLGFLVADKNMEACLHGIFERPAWNLSLGCSLVDIMPTDVQVAAGRNDSGLFSDGAELLKPFFARYRRMVMIVDAEWDGSPGAAAIEATLNRHLQTAGWASVDSLSIVPDPEIDLWLWTKTDHTARALGWSHWSELEPALELASYLQPDQAKPVRPKEAAEWALKQKRKPRSSKIYKQIAMTVGIRHCSDPAFNRLRTAMQAWFPVSQ